MRRYKRWRHARRYPKVGQVIRYQTVLVRVTNVWSNRDDLDVRWYDDEGRHDAFVSWTDDCALP